MTVNRENLLVEVQRSGANVDQNKISKVLDLVYESYPKDDQRYSCPFSRIHGFPQEPDGEEAHPDIGESNERVQN